MDFIRREINLVIEQLNLNKVQIKEVGKNEWKDILNEIMNTFVNWTASSPFWLWEHFKEAYSIDYSNQDAYKDLSKLVDDSELVWFLVKENREMPKFWVYEGLIKPIQSVIEECSKFEYYIVSKKYSWLLCENHHGYLIGTGEKMIAKMQQHRKYMILRQ